MIWRKTSEKTSWVVVIVSTAIFLLSVLFCVYVSSILSWNIALTIIAGCYGLLMIFVWSSFCMRTEWELVIEEDIIRWGLTKRPDIQKSLPVADIRALHHHFGMDNDIEFFEMSDGGEFRLPANILYQNSDSFIQIICKYFPNIKVIDERIH